MINWIKFNDQIPPLNKPILMGFFNSKCSYPPKFEWFKCKVYRPYDEDKKYNPNYYEFIRIKSCKCFEDKVFDPDLAFWTEIPELIYEKIND